jgi:hypothetical protein
MKNYLLMGAFWVFGLLLGSIWHQSELALSRAEISRLNRELASKTRRSVLPDMTRMMVAPDPRPRRPASSRPVDKADPPVTSQDISSDVDRSDSLDMMDNDAFAQHISELFDDSDSLDEAYKTLSDLWLTRRKIALASLIDHLGLTPAEVADFEAVIRDMNDAIAHRTEELFDQFAYMDEEPSPEEAFRMVHDFSGVFVATYDAMDETLPGDWRYHSGGPLDLTAFIDPAVFEPMMRFDDWGGR